MDGVEILACVCMGVGVCRGVSESVSVCGGCVNTTVLWSVNVLLTTLNCVSFSFVICVYLEYVCAAALGQFFFL